MMDNADYLDRLYERYLKHPESVGAHSQAYFNQLDLKEDSTQGAQVASMNVLQAYRTWGHLCANLDPLGLQPRIRRPELGGEDPDLEALYCGSVGFEFMYLSQDQERLWLQTEIDSFQAADIAPAETLRLLELLLAAEGLEKYLAAKYPGAKRFSLEGCDSLIVALDAFIQGAGPEVQEIVLGMTHRGRLNALVNLLGKLPADLFAGFEESTQSSKLESGSGDVKYHKGFVTTIQTRGSAPVEVTLCHNPSHLESVLGVVLGSVRARLEQTPDQPRRVLGVVVHGDAAFAGQGVVMEALNMAQSVGYGTGGTVHVIVNNQIGFTTSNAKDARSTHYCSDLAKMFEIPVFHVNADDPEAVCKVAHLALKYWRQFSKDVIIDLVGYRRRGHNEADEPSVTQPLMYQTIKKHPSVFTQYAQRLMDLGRVSDQTLKAQEADYKKKLDQKNTLMAKGVCFGASRQNEAMWLPFQSLKDWRSSPKTGLLKEQLKGLCQALIQVPTHFRLHPRLAKIMEDRKRMAAGEMGIDWGFGELLAYASLLVEGYDVRISGQDASRGTFFHRHARVHDFETAQVHEPLNQLPDQQGRFRIFDSLLSEFAVLAFEQGYAASHPRCLTIWEAQFGDFANGAQVVIDQFIAASEQKWGQCSGLVLFLPHGYEGQGPEHSSGRIERYLQLCAQDNLQVVIPSETAQMFHLLRRQMLRSMRKPLIVFTPKSLLRDPQAAADAEALSQGAFLPVIDDPEAAVKQAEARHLIFCSGKIYHELVAASQAHRLTKVAFIRIEQLYPFPDVELRSVIGAYQSIESCHWCQEEPENQGAWLFIQNRLNSLLESLNQQALQLIARSEAASPAVGSSVLHAKEQAGLLARVLQL